MEGERGKYRKSDLTGLGWKVSCRKRKYKQKKKDKRCLKRARETLFYKLSNL